MEIRRKKLQQGVRTNSTVTHVRLNLQSDVKYFLHKILLSLAKVLAQKKGGRDAQILSE